MQRWQLQSAKNKLSEVVDSAQRGPQVITRRGVDTAVVVSMDAWRRLHRPATGLFEFFRNSPLVGVELDLERSRETDRDVEL